MTENVIVNTSLIMGLIFLLFIGLVPFRTFYKADTLRIKKVDYINSDNVVVETKYELVVSTYFGYHITLISSKYLDQIKREFEREESRLKIRGLKKVEKIIDNEV